MGQRKEKAARGSTATLVARVVWLVEHADSFTFEISPAPSGQWFFADWPADRAIRRMSSAARGLHMDSICDAWAEHLPCSLPADSDHLLAALKGVHDTAREAIVAEMLEGWQEIDGRIWQRGLLKTYLSQVHNRLSNSRGGFSKAKNLKGLAEIDAAEIVFTTPPPYAPHVDTTRTPPAEQPSSSALAPAVQKKKARARGAEEGTPEPIVKKLHPELKISKRLRDAVAPDDFGELWIFRCEFCEPMLAVGQQQAQIDALDRWVGEGLDGEEVVVLLGNASRGGWRQIKRPRSLDFSKGRRKKAPAVATWNELKPGEADAGLPPA